MDTVTLHYDVDMEQLVLDQHCKMYKNDVLLNVGDTASIGDIIKIQCDTGYEFTGNLRFLAQDQNYGHWHYEDFTVNETSNIGTYEIVAIYGGNWVLGQLYLTTTQVDIVSGSNSLFKITDIDLKKINKDRFVSSGGNPPSSIDYGVNILGVIDLPFNIDPEFILEPETIKLGTLETSVSAPKISTDKLFYNLGDIATPEPDSVLDYANTMMLRLLSKKK